MSLSYNTAYYYLLKFFTYCIHTPGGTDDKPYTKRVGFLRCFGMKMGIHSAHFGLESGMVFEGTTGVYERIYPFNSK